MTFNDIDLKISGNEKILGVHVDQNFVWNNHYQHISKKISSHLVTFGEYHRFLHILMSVSCTKINHSRYALVI